ncbi:MAG: AAA family ATPase [Gammaproteobacteria bacterium RIFCSPHIGHO2_12_FULL_38_11]|nr:MAG: AAA family ATPase [Gammaproteobacteria bacterium RIFCSPHIGHO2_12_FULL_38_11]
MRRYTTQDLQDWITDSRRKPLIVRGARQVGKTWLVRKLAEITGKQLIEINLEQNPELRSSFNSNDPQKILRDLELKMNLTINLNESILFLDEIQAFPELLAKLRWFYELLPALPVVVTGSLLDFTLAEHEFSMPVGRVSYLHIEPLSFEEFLLAKGLEKLVNFLQDFQLMETISSGIHTKLMTLFYEYLVVGGLPYAVSTWIETNSLLKVSRAHNELLLTYRDDFAKYAGKISTQHLEEIMTAIPKSLGQKFVFTRVNNDVKIATLKQALNLLCKARLCYKIKATAANGLPLLAEVDDKRFKVGFIDVGLVSTFLGLRLDQLELIGDINLVNQGALSEQVVGQLLRCIEPSFIEPNNFYWHREEKSSNAEIDYILQHAHHIIPIEVKSGATGSMKSLQLFMHLKKRKLAVRINSDLPSLVDVNAKSHNGEHIHYALLSIPFYLTEQLHRLLQQNNKCCFSA